MEYMEKMLKHILRNFPEKELLYQKLHDENESNEATHALDNSFDEFCELSEETVELTSTTVLSLAKFLSKIDFHRLSCELIWCSGFLAVLEFIQNRGLKVAVSSDTRIRTFLIVLSKELRRKFAVFESCHGSFYTNDRDGYEVALGLKDAHEFIEDLRALELTEEEKTQLENICFDE
ncbi:unnamed protein product [Auanema sp. JU1783]|nr:unnamed protein product [Auanema sp. JU1783]